jgi:hypothetical protein
LSEALIQPTGHPFFFGNGRSDINARVFDFRICLLLLAAMAATARIDAQQPAKNEVPGSTLSEAEIRKLIDQLGVEQFRLREEATKRLPELADVPPALRAALKSDNVEASGRAILVVSRSGAI